MTAAPSAVLIDRDLLARTRETLRGVARRWAVSPAPAQQEAAKKIQGLLLEVAAAVAEYDELAALWGPVVAPEPPAPQRAGATQPGDPAADKAAVCGPEDQAATAPPRSLKYEAMPDPTEVS